MVTFPMWVMHSHETIHKTYGFVWQSNKVHSNNGDLCQPEQLTKYMVVLLPSW